MNFKNTIQGYRLTAAERFCERGTYENIVGGASKSACRIGSISCPQCGWWCRSDVWYPTIHCARLNGLADEYAKYLGSIVGGEQEDFTPETFSAFAAKLAPLLGSKRPLVPGTIFGVRPSWAIGKVGDFAWRHKDAPVVRESVFRAMSDAGFSVAGATMPYRAKGDLGERLIHLEMAPLARLSPASGGSICDLCGKYEPGRATIIDRASFDESVPLQRVLESRGILIVTAELADFLRSRQFTDVAVEPIEFQ